MIGYLRGHKDRGCINTLIRWVHGDTAPEVAKPGMPTSWYRFRPGAPSAKCALLGLSVLA